MKKNKTIKILAVVVFLTGFNAFADWTADVIQSPTVQGLYQLLNLQNHNTCIAPQASDVQPFCLGGLLPVTKPTIVGNPCGFSLKIECQTGASLEIGGTKQQFELESPQGVEQVINGGIIFSKVQYTPAN